MICHKEGPELESQGIAALGPNVFGFLGACNRKLNGMSVWCGLHLLNFKPCFFCFTSLKISVFVFLGNRLFLFDAKKE